MNAITPFFPHFSFHKHAPFFPGGKYLCSINTSYIVQEPIHLLGIKVKKSFYKFVFLLQVSPTNLAQSKRQSPWPKLLPRRHDSRLGELLWDANRVWTFLSQRVARHGRSRVKETAFSRLYTHQADWKRRNREGYQDDSKGNHDVRRFGWSY